MTWNSKIQLANLIELISFVSIIPHGGVVAQLISLPKSPPHAILQRTSAPRKILTLVFIDDLLRVNIFVQPRSNHAFVGIPEFSKVFPELDYQDPGIVRYPSHKELKNF
jgi:hypothetical protein